MYKNYSIFFSFFAGILSFFSPCILPLIPVYFSYITGYTINKLEKNEISYVKVFLTSLFFVLGFTTVFISLGASSTFIGKIISEKREILRIIGGIFLIFFGLHLTGILKIKKLYYEKRLKIKNVKMDYLGAYILGIGFSAGWTPCVAPVLSSILILSSMQQTIKKGVILLFFYSLGMGLPFIIISLIIKKIFLILNKVKNFYRVIEIILGSLLIIFGFLLLFNKIKFL